MMTMSPLQSSSNPAGVSPLRVDRSVASALLPDDRGLLSIRLQQAYSGQAVVGRRHGFEQAQNRQSITPQDLTAFAARLDRTQAAALNLVSFDKAAHASEAEIAKRAVDRTIVVLAGVDDQGRNMTSIAFDGAVHGQAKLSLASDDLAVVPGDELRIFPGGPDGAVTWAVLNCHDYTHVDLVHQLLVEKVEMLVVVTFNNAVKLYWEYALADAHRLFCFVAIINIGEIGGSAIYAPFRKIAGEKNADMGLGGQLLALSGPTEIEAAAPIDIGALRQLRNGFRVNGFQQAKSSEKFVSVAPSEHFTQSFDREAGAPPVQDVSTIRASWNGDAPLVAVGQLAPVSLEAYIGTGYRFAAGAEAVVVRAKLEAHLHALEARLAAEQGVSKPRLDFLVLPEVFAARSWITDILKPFSERLGSIVICGAEYPIEENANECVVLHPTQEPVWYRKITRSQYDAVSAEKRSEFLDGRGRNSLQRGGRLLRFENAEGRTFGVLVCYDYSHLDLMLKLNLEGRSQPLDLLFVVAHNPFANLYRACCVADAHRFYQTIVMCNVAQYGGSGVFAPRRQAGTRATLLELGKGAEAIVTIRLPLAEQRAARSLPDGQLHDGSFMRRSGVLQRRLQA